jgi:hypothetical protein
MPLPFYLAAGLEAFTGRNLQASRLLFGSLLYVWALCLFGLLRRHVGTIAGACFVVLLATSSIVYWGHMLLAETLIAYAAAHLLLLFLFALPLAPGASLRHVAAVSMLTATLTLSSLGWVPLAALAYALLAWQWGWPRVRGWRATAAALAVVAVPYAACLGPIFASGGAHDFVFDVYTFNRDHYASFTPDIPRGVVTGVMSMLGRTVVGAGAALVDFPRTHDLPALFSTLAVLTALAHFARVRELYRVAVLAGFVVLGSPRGGLGTTWGAGPGVLTNANFHAAPAIVLSLVAGALVVGLVPATRSGYRGGAAVGLLAAATAVAGVGTLAWCVAFAVPRYATYVGPAPLTAPASPIAAAVNRLVGPADAVWIGPYAPQDVFAVRARPASYFYCMLPWLLEVDAYRRRFLDDIERTKPKIVVWKRHEVIWGRHDPDDRAADILAYLDARYFTVPEAPALADFHFARADREPLLERLRATGYLR